MLRILQSLPTEAFAWFQRQYKLLFAISSISILILSSSSCNFHRALIIISETIMLN
ncbi:hypothetical protein M595_5875 [Lyngbya aestuarii BL J]|uniref:Uncharacterized protein n=1 Tax=Lyngbya aestuarii BL J TaxID=1348334 RepID=U7Q8N0_9CYAN|nr:hypothetical protein M595_5875 [Lyngbya aestuarii BL J]